MPSALKPLLTTLEGEFEYDAELTLPMRTLPSEPQWPSLRLRSNLAGTEVSLPSPFGKPADDGRAMDINLQFRPEGPTVDLRWQDVMQMNLALVQGIPQSGLIFLGSTSEGMRVRRLNPSAPGVELLGSIQRVDIGEWRELVSHLVTQSMTYSTPSNSGWWNSLQGTAEVSIGELQVFSEIFDALNLSARRLPHAWELTIVSEDIAGKMLYAVTIGEPWQVALDYLHIGEAPPEEEEVESELPAVASTQEESTAPTEELDLEDLPTVEYELPREDPLASLDPRNFPAMD